MPRIELIDPVLYQSNDPYHWEIDNLPLKNILRRQNLINLALDNVIDLMRDAIGTSGSVANRLNQSIEADGSLKTVAVDDALHSIEEHADTDDYVRMTKDQSDKLDLIADEATSFKIKIFTDDTEYVEFENDQLIIKPSASVETEIVAPNILKFNLGFPIEAAHQHHYGLAPVHVELSDPDYMNYKVDSSSSEYVEGSLRVTINGVRIFEDVDVYVPGVLVDDPWTLMSFTSDYENGLFELSTAISEDDIIRIDYDTLMID